MLWVILTVVCYTISSLGDKYIAGKLKCRPEEFSFLVSAATAVWILPVIIFSGWRFIISAENIFGLVIIIFLKLLEFYSSAILLKTVSAYELKAWLGINIILSYGCNVIQGKSSINFWIIVCSCLLLGGIVLINRKITWWFAAFILSKFFYGLQMGRMTGENASTSILFLAMLAISIIYLPKVKLKDFAKKEGIGLAVMTRLPNAAGLITEAMAATQNIFLYAMVQPMQLLILFVVSLVNREAMGKIKFAGSVICIGSIFWITIMVI